jgi:hypothetical protein
MEPVVGATTALVDAVRAVPGWGAVEEFITVNEAVGRVGTALAGGALEQSELMTALQEAAAGLQRLAHTAGVDLRGTL